MLENDLSIAHEDYVPYICVNSTNVVMNYSEIESKVREATNDDPWGPSGQLMGEIAK